MLRLNVITWKMFNASAVIFNCLNTKCEKKSACSRISRNQWWFQSVLCLRRFRASCHPKEQTHLRKSSNAKSNTDDQLVTIIANIPEFVIMSPDDKYTVHFVSKTKTIEVLDVNTKNIFVTPQLGGDFDFSTIKNVAFSEGREIDSCHQCKGF